MTRNDPIPMMDIKIHPWHIQRPCLELLKIKVEAMKPGGQTPFHAATRTVQIRGPVAYVPIKGILLPKEADAKYWRSWGIEATGYEEIRNMMASAVLESSAQTIVLEVDSPGGTVAGTIETADAIWNARKNSGKSVIAFVQEYCCSAAYYMASQAEQIIAGPNSTVGSIGTLVIYDDTSKLYEMNGIKPVVIKAGEFKGAGAEGTPFTQEQIEMIQPVINGMAENFRKDVSRGRGLSMEQVESLATGAFWLAPEAMARKLIDRITRTNSYDGVFEMDEKEKQKIAADAAADARKLMADLSREFPEDPQFAQEQFAKGSTITEAKAAYADKLKGKLKESQAAQDQLQTELNKAKAQTGTGTKTAQGCQPISAGGEPTEGGTKDFVAMARERAMERKTSVTEAMKELARLDPAGHKAWVESQGTLPVY